jgi:DNA polymerase I-like protein with 3'-5' exonuclease and polymerase domains
MLIRTPLSFRHSFTSRPGFVIIGCDFKSQEVKTAAYLSQDPTMLKAFTDPAILERLENNFKIEYSNPWVD